MSFVCPACSMQCGWDAKRQIYDAVQVEPEPPFDLQYAHRRCVEEDDE